MSLGKADTNFFLMVIFCTFLNKGIYLSIYLSIWCVSGLSVLSVCAINAAENCSLSQTSPQSVCPVHYSTALMALTFRTSWGAGVQPLTKMWVTHRCPWEEIQSWLDDCTDSKSFSSLMIRFYCGNDIFLKKIILKTSNKFDFNLIHQPDLSMLHHPLDWRFHHNVSGDLAVLVML